MRASVALALVGICLGAATFARADTSSGMSLRVIFWTNGAVAKKTWVRTLRCPSDGTLPRPRAACRRLARDGPALFAPVPGNAVCTEIYGGPQKARVVGTLGGRRIWATFTRQNGCHIARWDRLSPWLLPRGGVT